MSTATHTTIVGVFTNQQDARNAIRDLKNIGFRDDQLGMIVRDNDATTTAAGKHGPTDSSDGGTMAAEGAAVGAATGAGIGALWALGIAANVLPAIGPVIAGGIMASVLASAAGGAATVGLLGALVGLGLSEDEAKYYEGEVKSGRTVVTVRAGDRLDEARQILTRHGGYDSSHRPSTNF